MKSKLPKQLRLKKQSRFKRSPEEGCGKCNNPNLVRVLCYDRNTTRFMITAGPGITMILMGSVSLIKASFDGNMSLFFSSGVVIFLGIELFYIGNKRTKYQCVVCDTVTPFQMFMTISVRTTKYLIFLSLFFAILMALVKKMI